MTGGTVTRSSAPVTQDLLPDVVQPDERPLKQDEQEDSGDEFTTVSECSESAVDDELESSDEAEACSVAAQGDRAKAGHSEPQQRETPGDDAPPPQLRPGLFPPDAGDAQAVPPQLRAGLFSDADVAAAAAAADATAEAVVGEAAPFSPQETLFVFDWDDTILPSTWIQRQGLRLDTGSNTNAWQQRRLAEAADAAAESLRLAKMHGTVVLLTNAERGWIELSCQKFMPTLLPIIEQVKIVSARTAYESDDCISPLDWKVRAFETEIARACGDATLVDPTQRKNIHSLGDSVHERAALLRATIELPNCRSKSIKFVERPDIDQMLKQHALVTSSFDQIVHRDGNLDLCINCD